MSLNKRKHFENNFKSNKRLKTQENLILTKNSFNDISSAYQYLRSIFPTQVFNERIPTIVWRHQLYAIFENKTLIDRQLNKWSEEGFIRFFRLGSTLNDNEVAIVLMDDFQTFVANRCDKTIITDRFLKRVIVEKHLTQISSDELKNDFQLNDENITELIHSGLLARHRNEGNVFLMSVPNAGEFVKCFDFGKKFFINLIQKCKHKEISKSDLMKRRLPKQMKFSIEYHVYDLIGADLIQCVQTSSDTILRMT